MWSVWISDPWKTMDNWYLYIHANICNQPSTHQVCIYVYICVSKASICNEIIYIHIMQDLCGGWGGDLLAWECKRLRPQAPRRNPGSSRIPCHSQWWYQSDQPAVWCSQTTKEPQGGAISCIRWHLCHRPLTTCWSDVMMDSETPGLTQVDTGLSWGAAQPFVALLSTVITQTSGVLLYNRLLDHL